MKLATVYVMDAGDRRKVGHSVNPLARKNYEPNGEIGRKAVWKRRTIAYCSPLTENARKVEACAHRALKSAGAHIHGEWFSASVDKCIEAIERGLQAATRKAAPPLLCPRPGALTETVTICLSSSVKEALRALADADRRTLSSYITLVLEDYLAERADKPKRSGK